jgi:hypothetical protein
MKPVEAGQQQSFASRWAEVAGLQVNGALGLSHAGPVTVPLVIGPR